jgi:hypothetical protein
MSVDVFLYISAFSSSPTSPANWVRRRGKEIKLRELLNDHQSEEGSD